MTTTAPETGEALPADELAEFRAAWDALSTTRPDPDADYSHLIAGPHRTRQEDAVSHTTVVDAETFDRLAADESEAQPNTALAQALERRFPAGDPRNGGRAPLPRFRADVVLTVDLPAVDEADADARVAELVESLRPTLERLVRARTRARAGELVQVVSGEEQLGYGASAV